VAALTPGADAVHKISIIPRGIGALGHIQQLPTEERYLMTRHELQGKIDVLFGGRAAEQVVFGEISTGAHNDLQRATEIARAMVLEYGMGDTLGPVTYPQRHPLFLPEHPAYPAEGHREYSETTAQALDLETKKFLEERLEHVQQLLRDKRPLLDRITAVLLAKEVLEGDAFARMVREDVDNAQWDQAMRLRNDAHVTLAQTDKQADLTGPGMGSYAALEPSLPQDYQALLTPKETQQALFAIKHYIEAQLCQELHLMMVTVPLLVDVASGLNDMLDRDGSRTPVQFHIANDHDQHPIEAQIVQAATKWKRMALRQFGIQVGGGCALTCAPYVRTTSSITTTVSMSTSGTGRR
jgi:hypothetical protein